MLSGESKILNSCKQTVPSEFLSKEVCAVLFHSQRFMLASPAIALMVADLPDPAGPVSTNNFPLF